MSDHPKHPHHTPTPPTPHYPPTPSPTPPTPLPPIYWQPTQTSPVPSNVNLSDIKAEAGESRADVIQKLAIYNDGSLGSGGGEKSADQIIAAAKELSGDLKFQTGEAMAKDKSKYREAELAKKGIENPHDQEFGSNLLSKSEALITNRDLLNKAAEGRAQAPAATTIDPAKSEIKR